MTKCFVLKYQNLEGEQEFHGFRLFSAPKKFQLKDPYLQCELSEYSCEDMSDNQYELKISAKNIALFVHIDSKKFDFIASDNFFSLEPAESRIIWLKQLGLVYSSEPVYKTVKKEDFSVRSLYDLLENS